MSTAWLRGSTRAWRRTRLTVLNRDGWTCRLCGQVIDPKLKPPHPKSSSVHHVLGKAYGDDPVHLVAAHRLCNQQAGDPTKAADPAPRPVTAW